MVCFEEEKRLLGHDFFDTAMLKFLNVFWIKKQKNVNPNVTFKKKWKKTNYRENVLVYSIAYNFTR